MLRSSRCPRCTRRIPRPAGRCLGCGSLRTHPELETRRKRLGRAAGIALTLLGVVLMLVLNYSERVVPAVADWYTGMVIRYVPEPAMRFAPLADEDLPFYVCAKAVVRRVGTEASIATFAGQQLAITRPTSEGGLEISSYLDESSESGSTHRHVFRCTVRLEGTRWVLDELEIEAVDNLPAELAALEHQRRTAR